MTSEREKSSKCVQVALERTNEARIDDRSGTPDPQHGVVYAVIGFAAACCGSVAAAAATLAAIVVVVIGAVALNFWLLLTQLGGEL